MKKKIVLFIMVGFIFGILFSNTHLYYWKGDSLSSTTISFFDEFGICVLNMPGIANEFITVDSKKILKNKLLDSKYQIQIGGLLL